MDDPEGVLQQIEEAATLEQRTYPGGVDSFLLVVRQGAHLGSRFALEVGKRIFQSHDVSKLNDVFAPVNGTHGWVEMVGEITRSCLHCGCAVEALEAAARIPEVVADVRAIVQRAVASSGGANQQPSGMGGGVAVPRGYHIPKP